MALAGMNPGTSAERLESQAEAWLLRAAQRDQAAFESLYRALEVRLYNLALHMTGRRQDAEEAVQEAMHQVWIQCPKYKEGNAIGWLFRVVARASLHKLRVRRRHQRQDHRAAVSRPWAEESRTDELDREECLSALRRELHVLGEEHRCVLALYFCASMSQDEIAGMLAISQGTVSNRIREGLAELRQRMQLAGYASLAPVSHELLSDCLNGGAVPARLAHSVMTKVSGGASESMRLAAAGKPTTAMWAAVSAFVLVACYIAAGIWWGRPLERPAKENKPDTKPEAVNLRTPTPAVVTTPQALGLSWDFTAGPQTGDLHLVSGDWSWGTNKEVGGAMLAKNCTLVLPFDVVPEAICEIRCEWNFTHSPAEMACGWFDSNGKRLPGTLWCKDSSVRVRHKGWHTLTAYFDGEMMVHLIDGRVDRIGQCDKRKGAIRVGLDCENVCIRSIRVRSISQDDLPKGLRDVETVKEALNVQPIRVGSSPKPD